MTTEPGREALGRLVRETWCAWAREQPPEARKESWLIPWTELDAGQREVDMRIGEAVAAAERDRLTGGPVEWIEADPDQPGYKRSVIDIDVMVAQAVARERDQIRLAVRYTCACGSCKAAIDDLLREES